MYIKTLRRARTTTLALSASLFVLSSTAYAQNNRNADGEIMDEIVVSGSPFGRTVDETITGVSILTGDELQSRLAATIGETLKLEPGVSSTQFGAGASRPIIRGQGGDRVRVLANGIGSIDASSASPDHAVAVEPAQAERIEVLRGATTLRFGSSGSGGVVNVIDGRIPNEIPDGVSGAFRLGGTTVDDGYDVAGSVDVPLGESFVFHLDAARRDSEDYDIPGFAESEALRAAEEAEGEAPEEEAFGTLENSAVESESYTGGLSYIGDRGFFGVSVHQFNTDYGVPGGHEEGEEGEEEGGEEEEELVTIGLDQTRIDINGQLELDGFFERIDLFGGYADYEHIEFEGDEIGTVFTNEGFEVRVEALQRERGDWRAAYGVQVRRRDFAAIGDEAFVPPTVTEQYGIYTFHQTEIGNVHLEGALRYEHTDQDESTGSGSQGFDAFSVSAGGDVRFAETLRIGGTVFRTQRAPTTEELFSNGPHLATSQFEVGDPTLGLETAKGVELAFRHRADNHYLTANLFYTDYDDYIFESATGEFEDGLDVFQFIGEDASFRGFEIQGGADIAKVKGFDIKADSLLEFVRATTDGENLPRIPPLSILTGIEAQSDLFKLRAELEYVAEQNRTSEFELPTDDFTMTNAFADWYVKDGITLSVSVLNLFDNEGRQHTSFLKELAPLPGRNFRASIKGTF